MFWDKFKLAYRNLLLNKYISLFNILGLSIGIACTLILISWGSKELSSDSFIKNRENIYRLNFIGRIDGVPMKTCTSPQGVAPKALEIFPEVSNFTRIRKLERKPFKTGENSFYVDNGYSADSTFFSVFSYESIIGDLSKSLNRKDLVVIDENLAVSCFADKNPIGEIINIGNHNYTVSAVIKSVPENSHLQFQYIIPILNMPQSWINNKWGSDNCTTYLVLDKEIDKVNFEDKLTQLLHNNKSMWKELEISLGIQPLSEIYFSTGFAFEVAKKGNKRNVYILVSVAFLILLIASINFINIFISTSLKRTKSLGVKMVLGASRSILVQEVLLEVLICIMFSFAISFGLIKIALPVFNNLFVTNLEINILSFHFIGIAIPVLILTLLLSGLFPAYFITRLNPALILKAGHLGLAGNKNIFQRTLVILQFVIAILLISSILIIQKQVGFLNSKELGFNKDNIIYINTTGAFSKKQNIEHMKTQLLKNPNISSISTRSCLPTKLDNGGFMFSKENPDNKVHEESVTIGEDYFDLMQIKFVEGENDFEYSNNTYDKCIINNIAAEQLKLVPPFTGQYVFDNNENKFLSISGVVENVNTKSLYSKVEPCLYTKPDGYSDIGVILFKLYGDYNIGINAVKDYCMTNYGEIPFEYHFLDQTYDKLYQDEVRTQNILTWFSFISIFLTCLGLLSMVHFVTQNRTKEIGVRKINGAKITEIMQLLNRDFIKLAAIAFIIATPIAYYAMNSWLENFAYKITLSWWIFVLSGLIASLIAIITVSGQTYRAARRNPVESLRNE